MPRRLQSWRHFLDVVTLSDEDHDRINDHLRSNPGDTRPAAEFLMLAAKAHHRQRDELQAWCLAHGLLDEYGRPDWNRIRRTSDAMPED